MPVKAAGWRIEPPVSVPVAPGHSRAATAAADPPDDPPGASDALPIRSRRHGEMTLPNALVSFDEPIANWSMLSLPSIPAPAAHRFAVTVDFVRRHEAFEDVGSRRRLARPRSRTGP